MANKYLVKSATLSFGSGTHYIASIPVGKNSSCDAVEVTSIDDTKKKFIAGCVMDYSEFTVELYQGSGSGIEAGATGALSISVSLSDGTSTPVAGTTVSYNNVIVTKVDYPSIDATGDRKATYSVTFKPDGSTGSTGNL